MCIILELLTLKTRCPNLLSLVPGWSQMWQMHEPKTESIALKDTRFVVICAALGCSTKVIEQGRAPDLSA